MSENKLRELSHKMLALRSAIGNIVEYTHLHENDTDMNLLERFATILMCRTEEERDNLIRRMEIEESRPPVREIRSRTLAGFDSIRPGMKVEPIESLKTTTPPPNNPLDSLNKERLSPCGRLIVEFMKRKGMDHEETRRALNLTAFAFEKVLYGEIVFSDYFTKLLEKVFGVSADYWYTLDLLYHLDDKEKE